MATGTTFNITISPTVGRLLDAYASTKKLSKSAVCEQAIVSHIADPRPQTDILDLVKSTLADFQRHLITHIDKIETTSKSDAYRTDENVKVIAEFIVDNLKGGK